MKFTVFSICVAGLVGCSEKKPPSMTVASNPLKGTWATTDSKQFIHGAGKKLSIHFSEDRAYLTMEFESGYENKSDLGRYRLIGNTIEWLDSLCAQKDLYDITNHQLTLETVADSCNNENVGSKLVFSLAEKP